MLGGDLQQSLENVDVRQNQKLEFFTLDIDEVKSFKFGNKSNLKYISFGSSLVSIDLRDKSSQSYLYLLRS